MVHEAQKWKAGCTPLVWLQVRQDDGLVAMLHTKQSKHVRGSGDTACVIISEAG